MEKKTRSPRRGIKLNRTEKYTAKLEDVKLCIREYWEAHHYPPTIREIAEHFGSSTSNVSHWLDALEKDGWLEPRIHQNKGRGHGIARNIVPVEIFEYRPVFPDEFVGPSPMETVLPIIHDQLGKMTEFHGIDIGTGEDHSVEVLMEKMSDGKIAIVKAKKIDKETP